MSAISAKTGGRGAGARSCALEGGEGELVGHGHPVERQAAVAEVGGGEHAVVAEVAGLRPGEGDRRHHRGGLPAGRLREVQERAPRAGEQRAVAALVVDPEAGEQAWRGRASSARRPSARSGSPSAPRGRRRRGRASASASAALHGRGVERVVERRAAVGFDEDEEDVGAAQRRQDPSGRQARRARRGGLVAEAREVGAGARARRAGAPRRAARWRPIPADRRSRRGRRRRGRARRRRARAARARPRRRPGRARRRRAGRPPERRRPRDGEGERGRRAAASAAGQPSCRRASRRPAAGELAVEHRVERPQEGGLRWRGRRASGRSSRRRRR